MPCRILFLDIDGVLNSHDWWQRRDNSLRKLNPKTREEEAELELDPEAIERLNRVTELTGAVIVVSSTWRTGGAKKWSNAQAMLVYRGLRGEIVDKTPELFQHVGERLESGHQPHRRADRGLEIQAWLTAHPEVERFAIVDDDSDMAHLRPYLVKTHMDGDDGGLQDEHVERLVALLGSD